MRPAYTCRRCLVLVRRSDLSLNLRFVGPSADIRWASISTQAGQVGSIRPRRTLTTPFKSRHSTSSLETQGGEAKHEPLKATPPLSLNQLPGTEESTRALLRPHNLFHRFSESPSPSIRRRAAFIKQHAYCPHPDHHQTRLSSGPDDPVAQNRTNASQPPMHVSFECADCGIPVYCSEGHWADDFENHLEICDTLRQINEDDHDLRSGRFFPEFEYPGPQLVEAQVNMTNWDTFLYSREFEAINSERSMRQATRLLTYPVTIGSFLHELSPYNIRSGGRLTTEGLKSLSALRYTLHPPRSGAGLDIKGLRPSAPPARIFILGARAESSLPREVWIQLSHMFPRGKFHLIFIGPESMTNRDSEFPLPSRTPENPFGAIVEDRITHQLKVSTFVEYYHTLHKAGIFQPYDPYFDCFVLFHPGLGHPASSHEWEETLPQLLETKVPVLVTGYTEWDMQRDLKWVQEKVGGEVDLLLEPGENRFRSLRWDLNDLDPQDISCGNWGVWSFRGKRYETTRKDVE
ncbi:MAG: translational activator for mitochondrial COX1 [Geoglossum simile]|nr:MAG: translational activator for mitochondrial COX1 [Geoglossum simile]